MYHRLAAMTDVAALRSLRLCVSGSAPLAADLWHHLAAAGVPVLERYGMTETLLTLSNPVDGERRPGSVGVPLPGVEAAVDDADEHGVGELLVRGPMLCRGYWGHGPLSPDGWFATGDLVSLADDGYVTHPGPAQRPHHHRRAQRLSRRGRSGPGPPPWCGGGGGRRRAVGRSGARPWWPSSSAIRVWTSQSLRGAAAAQLASFKCPREVRLVEALPRNAMGKVLRKELH